MIRHPQAISWVDELVNCFESVNSGQKRWFTRKMKLLSEDQRDEVWHILETRGHSRPDNGSFFGWPPRAKKKPERVEKPSRVEKVERVERVESDPPELDGPKTIRWVDEEWDQLAEAVWRARKNNPNESVVALCRKVMGILPKDRHRNIRVVTEIKPLIDRLQRLDDDYVNSAKELEAVKVRLALLEEAQQNLPTKDSVLAELTHEDIVERFGEEVLQFFSPEEILKDLSDETLLSHISPAQAMLHYLRVGSEMLFDLQADTVEAIRELTATIKQQQIVRSIAPQKPTIQTPRVAPQLLRVTLVGLLPDQQRKVASVLEGRADFHFVDKNRKPEPSAFPDSQDIVFLWANFISHPMSAMAKRRCRPPAKMVVHHGRGIDTLIEKVGSMLPARGREPALV